MDLRPRYPFGSEDEDEAGGTPPLGGAPAGGFLARPRSMCLAWRAAAPRIFLADGEERPVLWRDSAAYPGDVVLQPEAPPEVELRKFLPVERLFHRLLRFWRLLW